MIMNGKKPNFFILGAPKCGTTSLAHWLGRNPYIYMSPQKEPHYYNTDLKYRHVRSEREYLRLFEDVTRKHIAIGEASVWYLYSREAVTNILRDIPDAKFIVCLRNPVDMAYSLHGQMLCSSFENIKDFKSAWEAQAMRVQNKKIPRRCSEPRFLLYGPASSLGRQVSQLFMRTSKSRVLPVFMDDLRDSPLDCYREILQFLNVPYDGASQFPVLNRAREQSYPILHNTIMDLHFSRKRMRLPRTYIGLLFSPLEKRHLKPSKRRPMEPDMSRKLYSYFEDDINKLEQLLDKDLTNWKLDENTENPNHAAYQ